MRFQAIIATTDAGSMPKSQTITRLKRKLALMSRKKSPEIRAFLLRGAGHGTRTHTALRPPAPKAGVSAISPTRRGGDHRAQVYGDESRMSQPMRLFARRRSP